MIKCGWLLDEFTLETEGGEVRSEIRLVRTPGGGEFLWHYENDRHVGTRPATRCDLCEEVLTAGHVGRRCLDCLDAPRLNV